MQTRTLGRSGVEVSALGFGCMGISFGPPSRTKAATPTQIALAWLLAQKPWIVPFRRRPSVIVKNEPTEHALLRRR